MGQCITDIIFLNCRAQNLEMLLNHYNGEHGYSLKIEHTEFANMKDFVKWEEEQEILIIGKVLIKVF